MIETDQVTWASVAAGMWHRLIQPIDPHDPRAFTDRRRAVCGVNVKPYNVSNDRPGVNVCRRCMMSRR